MICGKGSAFMQMAFLVNYFYSPKKGASFLIFSDEGSKCPLQCLSPASALRSPGIHFIVLKITNARC